MKKFVVIIIILLIIFLVMFFYKSTEMKSNNVNAQEVEQIENYINQIYLEKEIVGEAIPNFENINDANENWIWEVVKKNIEEDKTSYEQINQKAKEIFGQEFIKELKKEENEHFKYNEDENNYEVIDKQLDDQGTLFLLNEIDKTEDGYKVNIVEYLEDYSPMLKEEQPENYIIIRNLNGDEISRTTTSSQGEEIDIVKRNIDKFNKKNIVLKLENGKIYIRKVSEG